jgi:hypothetical protein
MLTSRIALKQGQLCKLFCKAGEVGYVDTIIIVKRAINSINIRQALGLQKLKGGNQHTLEKALVLHK